MPKQHDQYPPLETRRMKVRRLLMRMSFNLFTIVGVGFLFYLLFAAVFDTPAEYGMRQSTQLLRSEYEILEERLEELEWVLQNVEDRDRNVFLILFESEPYDFSSEFEASRWYAREELIRKTNNELAEMYFAKLRNLDSKLLDEEKGIDRIYELIADRHEKVDNIPSIQPILNNELTLLTASFGQRMQPYYKVLTMHTGVDYTVPEGTRVFATADGKVKTSTSRPSSTGNTVVIDHGNGYETHYNHLNKSLVRQGQLVKRGDIIALTGDTGLSLIPHLHYEIRYMDDPVDPINYFFAELGPAEHQRILKIAQSGMQSFD